MAGYNNNGRPIDMIVYDFAYKTYKQVEFFHDCTPMRSYFISKEEFEKINYDIDFRVVNQ